MTITMSEAGRENLERLAGRPLTISGLLCAVAEELTLRDVQAIIARRWGDRLPALRPKTDD
ncbi:MAG: hypothetical protein OXH69_19335 [Acidobacteria bacterium]|nr:hypothetical protein [Acidobacteriota bacterium]